MSNGLEKNVYVRKAKMQDMKAVCEMVKQLAVFHKIGNDQVKINVDMLTRDGFEANPPRFACFVAEIEDKSIVGYALYYPCYSTWLGKSIFLEDLYVRENYRKYGIGQLLLVEVAKVAYDVGERMDFHVISSNPAIRFYKKLGAKDISNAENWHLFRFGKNELENLICKLNYN